MIESFSDVFPEIKKIIEQKGLDISCVYRLELGPRVYRLQNVEGKTRLDPWPDDYAIHADCTIAMSEQDFVYLIRSPTKLISLFNEKKIRILNVTEAMKLGWALKKQLAK